MIVRTITILFFLTTASASFSQKIEVEDSDYDNHSVEMADVFREDGKIYTVVAVILTILGGIFFYLFSLDRRLKKLENNKSITESTPEEKRSPS